MDYDEKESARSPWVRGGSLGVYGTLPDQVAAQAVRGSIWIAFCGLPVYWFVTHPNYWPLQLSFFAACFATGGAYLYPLLRKRARGILLYMDGVLFIERGREERCHWDQIVLVGHEKLWRRSLAGVHVKGHIFTVVRNDGHVFRLDNFISNVDEIGERIQEESYKVLFPKAVEVYDVGGVVSCGVFQLSQKGLHYRKKTLPWDELKSILLREEEETIDVLQKGALLTFWASVKPHKVMNASVFWTLIARIRGQAP
jgi:hypothetical protein